MGAKLWSDEQKLHKAVIKDIEHLKMNWGIEDLTKYISSMMSIPKKCMLIKYMNQVYFCYGLCAWQIRYVS